MPLDPNIRKKLVQESRNPYKGLRRIIWIALFSSAGIGILIMGLRFLSGQIVLLNDFVIQLIAFALFASLIIYDRDKINNDN